MLVAIAGLVVLVSAVAAAGRTTDDSLTIAGAPPLPLDQHVIGSDSLSGDSGQGAWWTLQMSGLDRLVIDYSFTLPSNDIGPGVFWNVFRPSVTDYTLTQSSPIARSHGSQVNKDEFVFVAPSAGKWNFELTDICCSDGAEDIGYEFTAHLQLYTHLTVTAPPLVKVGSKVRLHATISGGATGNVLVKTTSPAGPTTAVARIIGGKVNFRVATPTLGRYHVKITYPGDAHHRPSAVSASFRAA